MRPLASNPLNEVNVSCDGWLGLKVGCTMTWENWETHTRISGFTKNNVSGSEKETFLGFYNYSACACIWSHCDPMGCSLPGSSVHGILQAGIWSGLPFPTPGDLPHPGLLCLLHRQAGSLPLVPPGKPTVTGSYHAKNKELATWRTVSCYN